MIFRRVATRELSATAGGVFVILFSILLTQQLLKLLKLAAAGKLVPEALVAMLGFGALGYLPVVLTLTLFVAVLMVFSRWYRDSEMAIWLASGASLADCLRLILRFAWPLLLLIAALSFWVTPWSAARSEVFRKALDQRDDAARVSAGAFNESSQGDRVFFVEASDAQGGTVRNVFVAAERHGSTTLIATATGHVETAENGDRFLVLERGRRYDTRGDDASFRVMAFERYGVRIEQAESANETVSLKAAPTDELWRTGARGAQAELLWRLGTPLSALVLVVLALPLAYAQPRSGGRTASLIAAILLYLVYNNLLNVAQAWVAQGRIGFTTGALVVHALMLAVALLLLMLRRRPLSWRRWLWR